MSAGQPTLGPLAKGGDTALFSDPRNGFSAQVPGRPQLAPAAALPSEPAYEALVLLQDLPVSLRYRAGTQPPPSGPAAVAQMLVESYAANRCRLPDVPKGRLARPEQLRLWGADAAASALYPLAVPDESGADREEVLVLLRGAQIVTWTKRFCQEQTSWVSWALCNSALAAGIRWGAAPAPQPWPPSAFLLPSVLGTLRHERLATAQRLAALVHSGVAQREELAERLGRLLLGSEPPSHLISEDERGLYVDYLCDPCPQALAPELRELCAEVRTAHDLRGLALLCLHVLGLRPAAFARPDEGGAGPLSYLAE